jgi:hypothetical protein
VLTGSTLRAPAPKILILRKAVKVWWQELAMISIQKGEIVKELILKGEVVKVSSPKAQSQSEEALMVWGRVVLFTA